MRTNATIALLLSTVALGASASPLVNETIETDAVEDAAWDAVASTGAYPCTVALPGDAPCTSADAVLAGFTIKAAAYGDDILRTGYGSLERLDRQGNIVWTQPDVWSSNVVPDPANGRVYASDYRGLRAYDGEEGTLLWTAATGYGVVVLAGERVVYLSTLWSGQGPTLTVREFATDGSAVATWTAPGFVYPAYTVAAHEGKVLFSTFTGMGMLDLDAQTLEIVQAPGFAFFSVGHGKVAGLGWTSTALSLRLLDLEDHSILEVPLQAGVAFRPPLVHDEGFYVVGRVPDANGQDDHVLAASVLADGTVAWTATVDVGLEPGTAAGSPIGVVAGDGLALSVVAQPSASAHQTNLLATVVLNADGSVAGIAHARAPLGQSMFPQDGVGGDRLTVVALESGTPYHTRLLTYDLPLASPDEFPNEEVHCMVKLNGQPKAGCTL